MSRKCITIIILIIAVGISVFVWKGNIQEDAHVDAVYPIYPVVLQDTYDIEVAYPDTYQLTHVGEGRTHIIGIEKGDGTKVEIFQASKYPVDRLAFGFTGEETPEEALEIKKMMDDKTPEEFMTIEHNGEIFDVWVYYDEDDMETVKEVKQIYESIDFESINVK